MMRKIAALVFALLALSSCTADAPKTAAQAGLQPNDFMKAAGPNPVFPPQAMRAGTTGGALLQVTTDARSRVTDVVVIDEAPAGQEFGRAAVDAVRNWTFEPKAAGKTFPYRVMFAFK